jgi:hypothetical protein
MILPLKKDSQIFSSVSLDTGVSYDTYFKFVILNKKNKRYFDNFIINSKF